MLQLGRGQFFGISQLCYLEWQILEGQIQIFAESLENLANRKENGFFLPSPPKQINKQNKTNKPITMTKQKKTPHKPTRLFL